MQQLADMPPAAKEKGGQVGVLIHKPAIQGKRYSAGDIDKALGRTNEEAVLCGETSEGLSGSS